MRVREHGDDGEEETKKVSSSAIAIAIGFVRRHQDGCRIGFFIRHLQKEDDVEDGEEKSKPADEGENDAFGSWREKY